MLKTATTVQVTPETMTKVLEVISWGKCHPTIVGVVESAIHNYHKDKRSQKNLSDAYVRRTIRKACDSKCFYCKRYLPIKEQTIDHKIPTFRGGTDDINNLVIACVQCNADKADATADEYLERLRPMLSSYKVYLINKLFKKKR